MESSDVMENKSEDFNEHILKQAAITFSLEGISRDLKHYLQKKITHSNTNISVLADLVRSVSSSPSKSVRESSLKEGSELHSLLVHVVTEIKNTDNILNSVLNRILEKEEMFKEDTK